MCWKLKIKLYNIKWRYANTNLAEWEGWYMLPPILHRINQRTNRVCLCAAMRRRVCSSNLVWSDARKLLFGYYIRMQLRAKLVYTQCYAHTSMCASLCWLFMTSSHTKFSPVSKLRMRTLAGWRQQRQRRHLKCSLGKHTTTNIINLLCTRCPRAFACINKWLTLKSRIVSCVTNVECTKQYSFVIMRIFISSTRSRQKTILIRKLPVVGLCGNCDGIWVNTISTNRFKICKTKNYAV